MPDKKAAQRIILLVFVLLCIGLLLFFGLYFGLQSNKCNVQETDVTTEKPLYGEYDNAAVAADAGPCSDIGKDILNMGGSVVDAGIAAMLCVGVLNSHSTGIGGGSFLNLYDAATGEAFFINSREVAPLSANESMYNGNSTKSRVGSTAVAVPGEIAGYWEAHQRFGNLEWKVLFEPAIKLASEGFLINSALASAIRSKRTFIDDPVYNLKSIFTNANGSLKQEGDRMTRPNLAVTLRAIADEGAHTFYNGSVADQIIKDLQDAPEGPSLITKDDLGKYRVEIKPLINVTLGNNLLLTPGPPSGGPVLCLIMNILKGFDFNEDSLSTIDDRILAYHRIVEAFKFAYAKRTELGDENFNPEITELVNHMTSDAYAEEKRLKINDTSTQAEEVYEPEFYIESSNTGTSHLSIVGEDGSALAITSTINTYFGSSVRGWRTGIIFNNEMDDFSSPNITNAFGVPPSPNNFIAPQKRPLSSMSPTIIVKKDFTNSNKRTAFVTGASGGTKITTGTALSIMNSLWFGKRVDEAVSMKRLHHQLRPNYVQYESGFEEAVIRGLGEKNHEVESFNPPGSVVQAIFVHPDNGKIGATSDKRKSGYPSGY